MTDLKELAKRLKDKNEFLEFQEYVFIKLAELDTVDGLEEMTNEQAGETARARKLAITKIQEILRPFIEFKEKHEYTQEEINEARAKRGL